MMTFECGETSTKLLKKPPSFIVLTTQNVVAASLRDLGYENLTYGAMRHELFHWIFRNIPQSGFKNMMF